MKIIAHIHTDFPEKFGIPRQSGLIDALKGKIIFEPAYRNPQAFYRLNEFSHIWLLWKFSGAQRENWSATVRPPRLGGNSRVGVFASRSPFRPNDIGLSCVKLEKIEMDTQNGPVLYVAGIDLMDKTPIYDIKPYVPITDCRPEAEEGYTKETKQHALEVNFPKELLARCPKEKQEAVLQLLAQDPRVSYIQDEQRVYGISFAGQNIRFHVRENVLTVCDVQPL